ncbi:MAG TPA: uroporphyrinogen-III C-methyltransferase [Nitrospiria bacterium]|nr:uroporphyrinogen-III C-methyltransferase [Nitrospiria bacterium]
MADEKSGKGKVYLVGAGPGDPRLITVRGRACLEEADVVVYDYLAPETLLGFCPKKSVKIFVGKRREGNRLSQAEINRLLIQHARKGKVVVRLKGGDPFIFGRGGEEAEALAEEGIPFEIVPGVTAAIAVPAYAGIPLTHRDWTSSVAFITGHEDPDKGDSRVAWDKIATGIGTLIFYMGVRSLPHIVEKLIAHGRSPKTPIALIQWGTRPLQRTAVGTLEDIVGRSETARMEPPVTIVVGEVVRLREKLDWYERLPLFGKKILTTRAEAREEEFSNIVAGLGGEAISFPTIEIVPPKSWQSLDQAIAEIKGFDWLILTSANGVRYFFERLNEKKKDARALSGLRICAIGPRTADALSDFGIRADLVPSAFTAEGVLEAFSGEPLSGKRVLLARAKVAREILPVELRRRGATVTVAVAYQTVRPKPDIERIEQMIARKEIDMITFTSSSTATNFAELLGSNDLSKRLEGIPIGAIGPVTARTVEDLGLRCAVVANEHTMEGLARALVSYFHHPD